MSSLSHGVLNRDHLTSLDIHFLAQDEEYRAGLHGNSPFVLMCVFLLCAYECAGVWGCSDQEPTLDVAPWIHPLCFYSIVFCRLRLGWLASDLPGFLCFYLSCFLLVRTCPGSGFAYVSSGDWIQVPKFKKVLYKWC